MESIAASYPTKDRMLRVFHALGTSMGMLLLAAACLPEGASLYEHCDDAAPCDSQSVCYSGYCVPYCDLGPGLEHTSELALALAQSPYVPESTRDVPELDIPQHGLRDGIGLVYEEYEAIVAGEYGMFFDRPGWGWLRALPRGNNHRTAMQLCSVHGQGIAHEDVRLNYVAPEISPPLSATTFQLPAARTLTGFQMGARYVERGIVRHPQIVQFDATGSFARLVSWPDAMFGTSIRWMATHAGRESDFESFPRVRAAWFEDPSDVDFTVRFLLDSDVVTAAFRVEITPGNPTVARVEGRLFARRDLAIESGRDRGVALVGFSSMFWKDEGDTVDIHNDEAHDADLLRVILPSGRRDVRLFNPEAGVTHVEQLGGPGDRPLEFGLLQVDRDATHYTAYPVSYEKRVSCTVSDFTSDVEWVVELYLLSTNYEGLDNVVALALLDEDLVRAESLSDGIAFSYALACGVPEI